MLDRLLQCALTELNSLHPEECREEHAPVEKTMPVPCSLSPLDPADPREFWAVLETRLCLQACDGW